MELFKLFGTIAVDASEALEEIRKTTEEASEAAQTIGKGFKKTGDGLSSAGKKFLPISTAVGGVGLASAKMSLDFEDSMAKVSTIADTAQVPFDSLQSAIVDLSNQTGISSSEIANNVYDAISAGQSTGDAVSFVSNSTKLARSGFAEAGDALDILTTIMNSYGLEADQVGMVSDTLIQTQNLGKTTVAELSGAMGRVIPTAKANSVALDQVATGYAIMTSNGVATAETTTYMNGMMNELGKSGTKVSNVLKEKTGQSFSELMDSGYSLSDVLAIVKQGADEQNLAFSDLWGSAEAGKAGLILLGDSAGTFNGTLEQMRNSTGATDEAFGKLDTTSYSIEKSINQLKNTAIELGNSIMTAVAPVIEKFAEKVGELSAWFSGLDENQKQTIVTIGGIVIAAAPVLLIAGKLISGVGSIISVVGKLGSALSFLTSPVGLIVAAIGLLVGGFIYLWNTSEGFRDFWIGLWDKIKEIAGNVIDALVHFFTKTIPDAFNKVIEFFAGIPEWWNNLWDGFKNKVKESADAQKNELQKMDDYLSGVFSRDWTENFGAFGNVLNGFFKNASNIWDSIKKVFGGVIDFISGVFTGDWGRAWNGVKNIFGGIMDGLGALIKAPLNFVISLINGAIDGLNTIGFDIPDWAPDWLGGGKHFGINLPKINYLAEGGVITDPLLLGYNPESGQGALAGEAGDEAIAPVSVLKNYIRESVSTENAKTINSLEKILNSMMILIKQSAAQNEHLKMANILEEILSLLRMMAIKSNEIVLYNYIGTDLLEEKIMSVKDAVSLKSGGRA